VYQDNGSGTNVGQTPRLLNSLTKDTVNNLWKESTPGNGVTTYPLNTTGQITSVSYVENAAGVRHTFAYSNGLLQSIQDVVGRLVTFGYSSNRLQSITDWTQRVTTFLYDTASAPAKALLTVTGPSGCNPVHGYDGTPRPNKTTDPNGNSTTYSYYSNGQVQQRTIVGVGATDCTYPQATAAASGQMAVTDPVGAIVTQLIGSNWNIVGTIEPLGSRVSITRNSFGQLVAEQDMREATCTTLYNASGIPVGMIDGCGWS
jgi:YD repeat-containing protein